MLLNGIDFDQDWEGERGEGVSQNMAAIYMYGKVKVQGHQRRYSIFCKTKMTICRSL